MKHIKIKLKAHSFTLLELLYVVGIISLVMPAMFALYNFMIKANREISARQSSIQQGYEFFERLNILVQDYRIDYEEYFNRQMVGCVGTEYRGSNFKWNALTGGHLSGYCTNFTTYGNGNSTDRKEKVDGVFKKMNTGYYDLYYCTSMDGLDIPNYQGEGSPVVVDKDTCGTKLGLQSYGQYETMFTDVKEGGRGGTLDMVGDGDDENVGYLLNEDVKAIQDSDNIQELYLISQDGKNRLYFRRKLIDSEGGYTQYRIQMLRLKGFDAGRLHNLDKDKDSYGIENRGIYDGKIDTWACDYSMGFVGHGEPISTGEIYSGYYLPNSVDDCWIDMTYGLTNVLAWNISVSPTGNPDLYWARRDRQINDYIKIFLANGVYMPAYGAAMAESIADFKIPLQTTINMEGFYK